MKKTAMFLFVALFALTAAFASFTVVLNGDDTFTLTVGDTSKVISGIVEETINGVDVVTRGGGSAYIIIDGKTNALVAPRMDNDGYTWAKEIFRQKNFEAFNKRAVTGYIIGAYSDSKTGKTIQDNAGNNFYQGIIMPDAMKSELIGIIQMDTTRLKSTPVGAVITIDGKTCTIVNPVTE